MKIIISISNLFQIFQAMSKAIFEHQQKRLKKKEKEKPFTIFQKVMHKDKRRTIYKNRSPRNSAETTT